MKALIHTTDDQASPASSTQMPAREVGDIIDKAAQQGVSDHHEIRELAKLILNLKPEDVDASMQAKFDQLMGKVRAQFA